MAQPSGSRRVLRFGAFQCDLDTGELRRNGTRLYLPDQPLRVLTMLLERPGELVTRQELQQKLWPSQEYGLFEDGLNTAVNRLRAALNDKAEKPRFIETIPRRGYRFIATVEANSTEGAAAAAAGDDGQGPERKARSAPSDGHASYRKVEGGLNRALRRALAGVATAGVLFTLWWYTPLPPPQITRVNRITLSARIDRPRKPVIAGGQIYYDARAGDHWEPMRTSVSAGDGERLDVGIKDANPTVLDVSPRDSSLLLKMGPKGQDGYLWTMLPGASPTRLGNITAVDAAFSPDGRKIAYISNALWVAESDGARPRRIAEVPQPAEWLAWSPDGQRLRFTFGVLDVSRLETSIWEIGADGRNLHRLFAGWSHPSSECCGSWTPDGRYYVFTSSHGGPTSLWVVRERGSAWRHSPHGPFRLTLGPDAPFGGTPGPGRQMFFYNGAWRVDRQVLHLETGELSPLRMGGLHVVPAFSRDGRWIVYRDQLGNLFRSRPDGATDRVQLASAQLTPNFPRWSPNAEWVAFGGAPGPGQPPKVYVVAAEGGQPQELISAETDVRDVDWSSDGKSLVVCHGLGPKDPGGSELLIVDFATRRAEKIPGSDNLAATRWSPDGRYISATNQAELKLWSFASRQWRVIARGHAFGFGVWSPDSRYLYFQDIQGQGQAIFRYDVERQQVDTIADFSKFLSSGATRCALATELAPDGSPVILFSLSFYDLFVAEVRWP